MSYPAALLQKRSNCRNILCDDGLSYGVAEVERRLSVVQQLEMVVRATRLLKSILQKASSGE